MVAPTIRYLNQKCMMGDSSGVNYPQEPTSALDAGEHIKTVKNIILNQKVSTHCNHQHHSRCVIVQDEKLTAAALEALKNGNMTPLIKEELKCTIQAKRMAHGLNELKVEFTEPVKHELNSEEKAKVERRREQNKLAARRFRERQRSLGHKLQKETQKLESANTLLNYEIRQLRLLKDKLQKEWNGHLAVCPLQTFLYADPSVSRT
ncbi:hypothetical protein ACJMK2_007765 [Sinanodonta woodiana]|uniref:BZIP domain-containing protein n=1 Tax=Sinanodonta woodiana TaxID=1069815 RepID=A0ABD3VMI7_SINWO